MPLPFSLGSADDRYSQVGSFCNSELLSFLVVRRWVNHIIAVMNFTLAGHPKGRIKYPEVPPSISDVQLEIVSRLMADAHQLVRCTGGVIPSVGRGRASIHEALQHHANNYTSKNSMPNTTSNSNPTSNISPSTRVPSPTVAQAIDMSRIALPKNAGCVDPALHLCPERAKVFKDLSVLVKPHCEWPSPGVRPCMMVSESEFEEFAQWALGSSFAVLIDEQDIPRKPNGRPLIAGLFAVLHAHSRPP